MVPPCDWAGQLVYLDLESGDAMHLETFSEGVTCLSWAQLETDTGGDGAAQSQVSRHSDHRPRCEVLVKPRSAAPLARADISVTEE